MALDHKRCHMCGSKVYKLDLIVLDVVWGQCENGHWYRLWPPFVAFQRGRQVTSP